MRIIFMGTPDFAVPSLKALMVMGQEILGVVCPPDRPYGRGKQIEMPATKVLALQHQIPVWQPEKPNQAAFVDELEKLTPDLIVVAAYGHILKSRLLTLPKAGCLNVHASLLPKYRGAAPIQRALFANEAITGITIMQMDAGMDTGDILWQKELPIRAGENATELTDRLAICGAEALTEALSRLAAGQLTPKKQDNEHATYAPKISKEDSLSDWNESAEEIYGRIRGLTLKSGLTSAIEPNLQLKIMAANFDPLTQQNPDAAPGQILEISKNKGILVNTGQGSLWLTKIHPDNRRTLEADAFARGYRIEIGMFFKSLIRR